MAQQWTLYAKEICCCILSVIISYIAVFIISYIYIINFFPRSLQIIYNKHRHIARSYINYTLIFDYIVSCPNLTQLENGMINCSLGDDGVSSYEDTCSFTCNTGYELTGSDTRTCQSGGSWSGNESVCSRGT